MLACPEEGGGGTCVNACLSRRRRRWNMCECLLVQMGALLRFGSSTGGTWASSFKGSGSLLVGREHILSESCYGMLANTVVLEKFRKESLRREKCLFSPSAEKTSHAKIISLSLTRIVE